MRLLLVFVALVSISCNRFEANTRDMTPVQVVGRGTHLFIGVIEKHEWQSKVFFRVTGAGSDWRVISMRVRVENVLRGTEKRPVIDIYEAFPTGGVSGDWNLTQNGQRYLFPVVLENGRYRVTRDFRRSIYPVYSGRHDKLPLPESAPFWERFALLQWWVQPDRSPAFGETMYTDPGWALGGWRQAKILRGLLHHPDKDVRLSACEDLLHIRAAQDECWNQLAPDDRKKLNRFWNAVSVEEVWNQNRNFEGRARKRWQSTINRARLSREEKDELRVLTTINNRELRREFCTEFERHFPGDKETGCPADRVPPATIVTINGDVPLMGEWPRDSYQR
jgi:hypothetical protein